MIYVLIAALAILAGGLAVRTRRNSGLEKSSEPELIRLLTDGLDGVADVKAAGIVITRIVADLYMAHGYYFYTRSGSGSEFVLTSAQSATANREVGPSYSGLAEFTGAVYEPPVSIPENEVGREGCVLSFRGYQMLSVPFGKHVDAVLHIGPLKKKPPTPAQIESIRKVASLASPLVAALTDNLRLSLEAQASSVRASASKTAVSSVMGGRQFAASLLGTAIKLTGALAAAVVSSGPAGLDVYVSSGFKESEEPFIASDSGIGIAQLRTPVDSPLVLDFSHSGKAFSRLNPRAMIVFRSSENASLLLWFASTAPLEKYMLAALQSIATRAGDYLGYERLHRQMSASYLDALKSVVRVMDAMETYTVSHSDLIAKYSRGIAEEMGLPEAESIEIAAYLHDVGMTALPQSILLKNGRYDKNEYEAMKSHAELGFALVESVVEPPGMSEIIRYHHERWDGWGYPVGKKEKEIPVGARILAVADTFNAKVSSRNYREGLPFEKALADVMAAAGTQFDPDVTAAFNRWWQKKRAACSEASTLEPCWEMKCCPAEIARTCIAFTRHSGPCFSHPDVKCDMHGDKCGTCIVHTEYTARWGR